MGAGAPRKKAASSNSSKYEAGSHEDSDGSLNSSGRRRRGGPSDAPVATSSVPMSLTTTTPGSSTITRVRGDATHGDWVFKRCTYMQIRFGCGRHCDTHSLLIPMTAVATRLVTLAKAHGATIDKVGFEGITLNWGIAGNRSASPSTAILAALEMRDVGSTLPPDLQRSFTLRIGIGSGMCATSTLSAAGHRFFIVTGREANVATDIAAGDGIPAALRSQILVSSDFAKEVFYAVVCSPRVYLGSELLWEPLHPRAQAHTADEWMYELRELDEGAAGAFSPQAVLLPLFKMARPRSR